LGGNSPGKYAIARGLYSPPDKVVSASEKLLLFGTAGIPLSSKSTNAAVGVERVAELGLECMELEFVRGARMSEASARSVREAAVRNNVKLSVHAPYFINLNAHEPEKVTASKNRILETARIAAACGAESVVFHPAFYLGDSPERVYPQVKQHLGEVVEQLKTEGIPVLLRPEVMGKRSQFGTLDELLALSTELDMVAPCIDFAHWHARTEVNNSYEEFTAILDRIEGSLGRQALDNMHIHASGISYGKAGEKKHLLLEESDLKYKELIRALKDRAVKGTVICESPNLEDDALLLQKVYQAN
jgi:deoxyribonuclease-4